ncbi:DUF7695 domain-containing protein [Paenibacillus naphthalenovorans]|uniref:DUF7695 domain-containing protein n=1 Tax=Paenibacillus naphthalenovorans TaxID=162209 RepID=A0A0U2MWA7_9BACL|nr:hypothetical protein [Paenibacillus naphthalenovorans]ALS22127.1 hypothetical protein IJ22_17530 [Paenibacillus naphthalenovorans]
MSDGNRIQCKTCKDIIQSMKRHDYIQCGCGKIAIDGGSSYQKISFPSYPTEDWVEFDQDKFE